MGAQVQHVRLTQSDQPFFLDVHFNAPHWPGEAPGDQAESDRLRTLAIRDFDGGTQRTYKLMVERMDFQIGRVLQALNGHGLTGNTIVVFTSDNGGERFADTWPFTGRKTELLEGGLRIPAVLRWPSRIRGGQTSDQVTISMDWLPTLLAAAGTAPAPDYPSDGMDLLPAIADGTAPSARRLFWRYKANYQRAARDGDWKILKIADNTFLFDVAADPMERANLKDRHRDVYDRLVAEWNAWDAGMLPEVRESFTEGFTASQLADHIGARPVPLNRIPRRGGPAAQQSEHHALFVPSIAAPPHPARQRGGARRTASPGATSQRRAGEPGVDRRPGHRQPHPVRSGRGRRVRPCQRAA